MNERPGILRAECFRHTDGEEPQAPATHLSAADADSALHIASSDPSHGCVDWYEYEDDADD